MKLVTFTIIAAASAALFLTAGCKQSLKDKIHQAEQSGQTEEQSKQAEQDAQLEYLDEWRDFRHDAEEQLDANAKAMDDLKLKLASANDAVRAKVGSQIDSLKTKNSELKKRLDSYRDEGKLNWDAFKRDFSHDLDGLGKKLKDLTTDNK